MRKTTEILKKLKKLRIEKKHFRSQLKFMENSDSLVSVTGQNFYKRKVIEAKEKIDLLKWVLNIKKK